MMSIMTTTKCARSTSRIRGADFRPHLETCTPEQWADLLKAILERAAGQGDQDLSQKLVDAGAEIGRALH